MNLPMGPSAGDREYLLAFDEKIIPALDSFRPQFILISAGFDAHIDDLLSNTSVTTDGFRLMTERVIACALRHCQGKIVSVLEGGYHLGALAESVEAHLKVLAGAE